MGGIRMKRSMAWQCVLGAVALMVSSMCSAQAATVLNDPCTDLASWQAIWTQTDGSAPTVIHICSISSASTAAAFEAHSTVTTAPARITLSFTHSSFNPSTGSAFDGANVLARRSATGTTQYMFSLSRRDGKIMIKKKSPGGSGACSGSCSIKQTTFAPPVGVPQAVTATVKTEATTCSNGQAKVTLTLKVGSSTTLTVTDCGQIDTSSSAPTCPGASCVPPITAAGQIGITAYGSTYTYDNLLVTDLP